MASVLPLILAALGGFAIVLTLSAFWASLRALLSAGAAEHESNASPQVLARTMLVQEKNAALQSIRDLRFEQELGKLSAADFQRLEAQQRARARELLAQLDSQLSPYRDEARKRLGQVSSESQVSSERQVTSESATSATPTVTPTSEPGTCAKCSTRNDADAVFCKKCGAQLAAEGAS
jgi:hypothetical protein